MKRVAPLLCAALLSGCVIAPIRPVGLTRQIDLDACYVWPNAPGAHDHNVDYFILSDGSPSFRSVHWIAGLEGDVSGCDFAFTIGVQGGLSPVWVSKLYALPSRQYLTETSATGLNLSNLAWAVYRAVEPGTPAYAAIKAQPGAEAAAPSAQSGRLARPAEASAAEGLNSSLPPEPTLVPPAHERPAYGPVTLREAQAELLP